MTALTAIQAIKTEYKNSRNFITPYVIRYGKLNKDQAYELSSGKSIFDDNTIYGVSIVDILDHDNKITKRRTDLSNCFQSLQSAEYYIQSLKDNRK